MTDIHETAYPRLKSDLPDQQLKKWYTPSAAELRYAREQRRRPSGQFALLVLLKTFQRLGYFVNFSEVPERIKSHIADSIPRCTGSQRQLKAFNQAGARQRLVDLLRKYFRVKAFDQEAGAIVDAATLQTAETRQELPDLINVAIEELIKQRYELPGFSRLLRSAKKSRTTVNTAYYGLVMRGLTLSQRRELDALLKRSGSDPFSGWNRLKQEPRKPTNKEVRGYLQHIQWLQAWTQALPAIDGIPVAKRRQFTLEARALDAADLRRLKADKRYTLVVILLYSQLHQAIDNLIRIFTRRVDNLHTQAELRLQQYRLEQMKRTEQLIGQFRDLLDAYQREDSDRQRIQAIRRSLKADPQVLLEACEEYMAFADNNYYPLMLPQYQPLRPLLLNCLALVDIRSSTSDNAVVKAVEFILANRASRKEWVPLREAGAGRNAVSLHWIPEKWRKLVTGKASAKSGVTAVHRKYFELCVLSQVAREIRSADLVVADSEEYGDFNSQLVDQDTYEREIPGYCDMLGFSHKPQEMVRALRQSLRREAEKLDLSYPDNESLSITDSGLTLHRGETGNSPPQLERLLELLKDRLEKRSILDVLVETEGWLGLHKKFGPISGFGGKVKDARRRFITTLFCYGCNLGPSQTAQSIKEFSRKQVAWLNLHHVTEERLDKAIVEVVNAYNRFRLPNYWGSGKSVAADGTIWNLYEQNLLSEFHIRYGGYGGIGYYHVSDKYIALFSHFIPCGVYEAIYILDGLIKNESEIQPNVVHGDTQAQSTTVFGLAYLLGIELMPRIRNIRDLTFFKADREDAYEHINGLFQKSINWRLIETHLPDMLRVALSIKMGKIAPSAILRRLGTKSRKNRLYFAFRELGRVVRTIFLLKYIGDLGLRQTIHAATNKNEEFNGFTKWWFFGGQSVIAENIRHEQNKVIKYNHLVSNLVILYNVEAMTVALRQLQKEGVEVTAEILRGMSPYWNGHINRFGNYTLDLRLKTKNPSYDLEILD